MNLPESKNDILSFAAEEAGISRKKMSFIIRHLEKTLRTFLSDPVGSGGLVKIVGFIHFSLKKHKLKEKLAKGTLTKNDKEVLKLLNKEYDEG